MVNRTLAFLILFTATALAGCVLVVNFYQAKEESKNLNWQDNSFNSRQVIRAEAILNNDLIN